MTAGTAGLTVVAFHLYPVAVIDFPSPEERRAEAQRLLDGLNGRWVASRMNVSKATVRLWRRGDRIPDLEDLLRLPAATGRVLDAQLHQRVFGQPPADVSVKDRRLASG